MLGPGRWQRMMALLDLPGGLSLQSLVEGIIVLGVAGWVAGQKILNNSRAAKKLKQQETDDKILERTESSDRLAKNWKAEWEVSQAAYTRLQQSVKEELATRDRQIDELKMRLIIKEEEVEKYERKTADIADQHLALAGKLDMLVRQVENFMNQAKVK